MGQERQQRGYAELPPATDTFSNEEGEALTVNVREKEGRIEFVLRGLLAKDGADTMVNGQVNVRFSVEDVTPLLPFLEAWIYLLAFGEALEKDDKPLRLALGFLMHGANFPPTAQAADQLVAMDGIENTLAQRTVEVAAMARDALANRRSRRSTIVAVAPGQKIYGPDGKEIDPRGRREGGAGQIVEP